MRPAQGGKMHAYSCANLWRASVHTTCQKHEYTRKYTKTHENTRKRQAQTYIDQTVRRRIKRQTTFQLLIQNDTALNNSIIFLKFASQHTCARSKAARYLRMRCWFNLARGATPSMARKRSFRGRTTDSKCVMYSQIDAIIRSSVAGALAPARIN